MIKLNCKNSDALVIGPEHGLNLKEEFEQYKETITNIITSLNQRKDKPKIEKYIVRSTPKKNQQ